MEGYCREGQGSIRVVAPWKKKRYKLYGSGAFNKSNLSPISLHVQLCDTDVIAVRISVHVNL